MPDSCPPPHGYGSRLFPQNKARAATCAGEAVGFVRLSSGERARVCSHPADSQEDSQDQSKVIVGVVVGLLIVAGLMGLIYWFYMKNSRYGWMEVTSTCESPEGPQTDLSS